MQTATVIKQIVVFISLVFLFLIGAHGYITTTNIAGLKAYDPLPQPQDIPWMSELLLSVLMIFLPICVLALAVQPKPLARSVMTVRRKDGTIRIASQAIVKCILTTLSQIPDVLAGRCSIIETRNGLVVKIRAYVRLSDNLPRIDNEIKSRIQNLLRATLGVERIADIRVVFTDIKMEQKAAARTSQSTNFRQSGMTPASPA